MLRKKRGKKGFTLIELLIVIAIIGILAAIAIPMYKTQTIKAKLTEVTNAMSTVSSAVAAHYQQTLGEGTDGAGLFVACINKDAIAANYGVGLEKVGRVDLMDVTVGGLITAKIATGIDSAVDGKTIILKPDIGTDFSITWGYDESATIPAAYRPKR